MTPFVLHLHFTCSDRKCVSGHNWKLQVPCAIVPEQTFIHRQCWRCPERVWECAGQGRMAWRAQVPQWEDPIPPPPPAAVNVTDQEHRLGACVLSSPSTFQEVLPSSRVFLLKGMPCEPQGNPRLSETPSTACPSCWHRLASLAPTQSCGLQTWGLV